jgi:hypothetical protein
MSLRALEYPVCIRLAAGIKSPSDLLITTTSATSTIPFLIPEKVHLCQPRETGNVFSGELP